MRWFLFARLSVTGALALNITFPVEDVPSEPVYITIPQTVAVKNTQVSLHADITCGSVSPVVAAFNGSFQGNRKYPAVSFFVFDPRPSPDLATVCVSGNPVGHLYYHPLPVIPSSPFATQKVEVRQFVNPGWSHRFPDLPCTDCSSDLSTLAFKIEKVGNTACAGRREERNAMINVTTVSNDPVELFPFRVNVTDSVFQSWTVSTDRFPVYDENATINTPVHLCFYSNPMAINGQHLGTVQFLASDDDTSALVFFILFIAIMFPVVCIITTTLHCYKLKRHRQFIRSLKHYIQGIQLEQEMRLVPEDPLEETDS
jgi:hypothetical protein